MQAFAQLSRDLRARRLAALDPRARVVLLALFILASGFAYWQVRIPLDGMHRMHGTLAAVKMLVAELGAFALAAGILAAWRLSALLARVPGPEWLALPVTSARVLGHLRAEARLPAYSAFGPVLAALAAGVGLVPLPWLGLLGAAFVVAWLELTRLGTLLAGRASVPREPRALPAATRLLLAGARHPRARPLPVPVWRRESAWRALARLDALASGRATPARARLLAAVVLFGLGLLAWFAPAAAGDPQPVLFRRALAFLMFAGASAALGAWAIACACADPAPSTRPLPLSLADAWRARALPIFAALAALAALNSLLATGLPPAARAGLVLTWWAPAAAVATLGLHYGLTLQPRASVAENLYFGWLGVALAASIMVPFLGWGVMIAGLVHSSLRLKRWWQPEVV